MTPASLLSRAARRGLHVGFWLLLLLAAEGCSSPKTPVATVQKPPPPPPERVVPPPARVLPPTPPTPSIEIRDKRIEASDSERDGSPAEFEVDFSRAPGTAALTVVCKSDPPGTVRLISVPGNVTSLNLRPAKSATEPVAFALKASAPLNCAKAVVQLDFISITPEEVTVTPPRKTFTITFARPKAVAIEWLAAKDRLVSRPDSIRFPESAIFSTNSRAPLSGNIEALRIKPPTPLLGESAVRVALEGGVAASLQLVSRGALAPLGADVTVRETTTFAFAIRPDAKPGDYSGHLVLVTVGEGLTFEGGESLTRLPVQVSLVLSHIEVTFGTRNGAPPKLDFGDLAQHHVANEKYTRPAEGTFAVKIPGEPGLAGSVSVSLGGKSARMFRLMRERQGGAWEEAKMVTNGGHTACDVTRSGSLRIELQPASVAPNDQTAGRHEASLTITPQGQGVYINGKPAPIVVPLCVCISPTGTKTKLEEVP